MKKGPTLLFIVALLMMSGCEKQEPHEIEIIVPAGSSDTYVYSDAIFTTTGDTITISSGAAISDTEIILKPISDQEENAYEPAYLTRGMPVKMDVEKGASFRIGAAIQNEDDQNITVSVVIRGIMIQSE